MKGTLFKGHCNNCHTGLFHRVFACPDFGVVSGSYRLTRKLNDLPEVVKTNVSVYRNICLGTRGQDGFQAEKIVAALTPDRRGQP